MSPKIKEGFWRMMEGILDDVAKLIVMFDMWLAKKSGKD